MIQVGMYYHIGMSEIIVKIKLMTSTQSQMTAYEPNLVHCLI